MKDQSDWIIFERAVGRSAGWFAGGMGGGELKRCIRLAANWAEIYDGFSINHHATTKPLTILTILTIVKPAPHYHYYVRVPPPGSKF